MYAWDDDVFVDDAVEDDEVALAALSTLSTVLRNWVASGVGYREMDLLPNFLALAKLVFCKWRRAMSRHRRASSLLTSIL